MKRENIDWAYLRGGVMFFVSAAVFSGSLIAGSHYFEKQMARQHRLDHARFQDISSRYLAVDEEEKLIEKYLPQFLQLNEIGVLGEEQRLSWVEVLRNAGDQMKLPALGYEITSQRDYTPGFPVILGQYKIFVSNMNLNMQLLHEGDLFRLLGILNELTNGRYTISECELIRNFEEITDNVTAANVAASCELKWFSVKLANGEEIKV